MYNKTPLFNQLRTQIQAKTEGDFQRFITDLFLKIFGSEGFIVLRETRDKGCDGIILSENCAIACYGPRKFEKRKFDSKVTDDYNLYTEHWRTQYPNWKVIFNGDLSPDLISTVNSLHSGAVIIGCEQILALIEERLNHGKLRSLALDLGISRDIIYQDILGEVLSDLVREPVQNAGNISYKEVVYLENKINLNFDLSQVQEVIGEFEDLIEMFPMISDLISNYDDTEKTNLKTRIRYDLNLLQGDLKSTLNNLTDKYLNKYSCERDDSYLTCIRAVLLYLFEQCLIGKKTEEERNAHTSS